MESAHLGRFVLSGRNANIRLPASLAFSDQERRVPPPNELLSVGVHDLPKAPVGERHLGYVDLCLADDPQMGTRVKLRERARYWISVSSLNIGRYIEMMITPTISPTPIIMSGSRIEVRVAIELSTSSS